MCNEICTHVELKADNAALRGALKVARRVIYYDEGWPIGWSISRVDKALATDHPGAELLRERAELLAEVQRLRKRLEIIDGHEEFDGIACRDETIRHLESEVERLRGLVKHLEEQTDSQYDEAVTTTGNEVDATNDERLDRLTQTLYQLQYNAEQLIQENRRLKERIKELEEQC